VERIITKSFARLMGRGIHRGFITHEELSKSLGKRNLSNQNLEQAFIHIFDLEAVVLGGGAIEAWSVFQQHMFKEARRRSFIQQMDPRPILRSGLGSRAGIYGAACLGFGRHIEVSNSFPPSMQ